MNLNLILNWPFVRMLNSRFCQIGRTFSKLAELFCFTGRKTISGAGNTVHSNPPSSAGLLAASGQWAEWVVSSGSENVLDNRGRLCGGVRRCYTSLDLRRVRRPNWRISCNENAAFTNSAGQCPCYVGDRNGLNEIYLSQSVGTGRWAIVGQQTWVQQRQIASAFSFLLAL
jgi:hypothetical protein